MSQENTGSSIISTNYFDQLIKAQMVHAKFEKYLYESILNKYPTVGITYSPFGTIDLDVPKDIYDEFQLFVDDLIKNYKEVVGLEINTRES